LYLHKGSNKRFRIHYRNYSRRRNCGDSRYVLAIPILAILKIVFDRIESLEAWGYLMGDNMPKNWKKRHRCPERNLKLIKYYNFR
jgi:hypothetical protein